MASGRKRGGLAGLIVFLLVVAVAGGFELFLMPASDGASGESGVADFIARIFGGTTEVSGLIGSEKANFLNNREVQAILADRYGLEVSFRRAGSFEMLGLSHEGLDFLWPSSQVALENYRLNFGSPLADAIIFNSPIVMYSWTPVVNELGSRGLIAPSDGVYRAPLEPLLRSILLERTWGDVGVEAVFGRFAIISTDPLRSNSGNMFAGLVANTLAGGVVRSSDLPAVLPDVLEVFRVQGQMEHSTGTLFERYLQLGIAQFPLIVGYESQYIEFARENPDLWPEVRTEIALIYPVPTVWSSHPLIALTESGQALLAALGDEEIQQLAWTQHGFRSGAVGARNDPADLGIDRVAETVTQVMQMPRPEVVFEMMDALEGIQ